MRKGKFRIGDVKMLVLIITACFVVIFEYVVVRNSIYKNRWELVWYHVLFGSVLLFLFYRLGNFPHGFIDELNGMYDSYSMAMYNGLDSHLLRYPVYLQSFAGQGQSVFYAYLAGPSLRLLGYNLFAFRLPMVIMALGSMLAFFGVVSRYYHREAVWLVTALSLSPYPLTLTRFGMDCNVAFWLMVICSCFLIQYLNCKNHQTLWLILVFVSLGLVAYSYNVSWFYLPVIFIGLVTILLAHHRSNIRQLIVPVILMMVELTPILTFAIRSNVPGLNNTVKLGFFTSPRLLHSRTSASIISFGAHPLLAVLNNIITGLKQLFITGDGLSWNSLPNFGAYYLISMVFVIVGLVRVITNWHRLENQIILLSLVANLPILLVVIPNYNHWMFVHVPIILLEGIGIATTVSNRKSVAISMCISFALLFGKFAYDYFNVPRDTGTNRSSLTALRQLSKKSGTIYFQTNDQSFLTVVRNATKVSPMTFQKSKDHPYSRTYLAPQLHFLNYQALQADDKFKREDRLVTNQHQLQRGWKIVREIQVNGVNYWVYKPV